MFRDTHKSAMAGELWSWRESPEGALAEIIVLDQFSRNIFRDRPESFASDGLALTLAQTAVRLGQPEMVSGVQKSFFLMPYMHSESRVVQEESIRLFSQDGADNLKYATMHKKIIDQFGRYPHRNKILGRRSTPEELEFLKSPDSSF